MARTSISSLACSIAKLSTCFALISDHFSAAKRLTLLPHLYLAVAVNNYSSLREQQTSTTLTSWHRNHHCLLLLGLPRAPAHNAGRGDDGAAAAAAPAHGAHHERARVDRLLGRNKHTLGK